MLHCMHQELVEVKSFWSEVVSVRDLMFDRNLISSAKEEGERIVDSSREIICIDYKQQEYEDAALGNPS